MALSHNTLTRNAILNTIDDQVNAGTGEASGDMLILDGVTTLVTFTLDNPAFDAAAAGTMAMSGLPMTEAASATGDADSFDIRDRDNTVIESGTITATGGGGDIEADNISIASAQNVTLNTYTLTGPA